MSSSSSMLESRTSESTAVRAGRAREVGRLFAVGTIHWRHEEIGRGLEEGPATGKSDAAVVVEMRGAFAGFLFFSCDFASISTSVSRGRFRAAMVVG